MDRQGSELYVFLSVHWALPTLHVPMPNEQQQQKWRRLCDSLRGRCTFCLPGWGRSRFFHFHRDPQRPKAIAASPHFSQTHIAAKHCAHHSPCFPIPCNGLLAALCLDLPCSQPQQSACDFLHYVVSHNTLLLVLRYSDAMTMLDNMNEQCLDALCSIC
jgi:hypothetical protein